MKLIKKYNKLKKDLRYVDRALAAGDIIVNCGVSMNVFEMAILQSNIQKEINVIEEIEIKDD